MQELWWFHCRFFVLRFFQLTLFSKISRKIRSIKMEFSHKKWYFFHQWKCHFLSLSQTHRDTESMELFLFWRGKSIFCSCCTLLQLINWKAGKAMVPYCTPSLLIWTIATSICIWFLNLKNLTLPHHLFSRLLLLFPQWDCLKCGWEMRFGKGGRKQT